MTLTEFARKYGVPYSDVRNASFKTVYRQNHPGRNWVDDYAEADLKQAVRGEYERALKYHGELANRALEKLNQLDGKVTG